MIVWPTLEVLGTRGRPGPQARIPATASAGSESFKICGEGEFPENFLLKGEPAKGKAL